MHAQHEHPLDVTYTSWLFPSASPFVFTSSRLRAVSFWRSRTTPGRQNITPVPSWGTKVALKRRPVCPHLPFNGPCWGDPRGGCSRGDFHVLYGAEMKPTLVQNGTEMASRSGRHPADIWQTSGPSFCRISAGARRPDVSNPSPNWQSNHTRRQLHY